MPNGKELLEFIQLRLQAHREKPFFAYDIAKVGKCLRYQFLTAHRFQPHTSDKQNHFDGETIFFEKVHAALLKRFANTFKADVVVNIDCRDFSLSGNTDFLLGDTVLLLKYFENLPQKIPVETNVSEINLLMYGLRVNIGNLLYYEKSSDQFKVFDILFDQTKVFSDIELYYDLHDFIKHKTLPHCTCSENENSELCKNGVTYWMEITGQY